MVAHILVPIGPCCSSAFTAASAPWKPILECVPSQNGLLTEPPQRQSATAGFPVMSYLLPLMSVISTWLMSPLTTYGPLGLIRILTAIEFSRLVLVLMKQCKWSHGRRQDRGDRAIGDTTVSGLYARFFTSS